MVQENSVKERIIAIGGPTCVGKSAFAVKLARKYNGEIISADSVQIYRGLDIGSGKITEKEMRGIPHYMLSIIDPLTPFTVVDFVQKASEHISDIISRGKLPIVVGGTGFYLNALLNGYSCGDTEPNYELRERMHTLQEIKDCGYLGNVLTKLDTTTTLHANDTPRLERQLETIVSSGNEGDDATCYEAYDALLIIMDANRSILDDLAAKRIDYMLDHGLLEEVMRMKKFWKFSCMSTVGYREVVAGLECGLDKASIADLMRDSYHGLIKKQQIFFNWMRLSNEVYSYNGDMKAVNKAVKEFLSQ